jgi:hypothetical protein
MLLGRRGAKPRAKALSAQNRPLAATWPLLCQVSGVGVTITTMRGGSMMVSGLTLEVSAAQCRDITIARVRDQKINIF